MQWSPKGPPNAVPRLHPQPSLRIQVRSHRHSFSPRIELVFLITGPVTPPCHLCDLSTLPGPHTHAPRAALASCQAHGASGTVLEAVPQRYMAPGLLSNLINYEGVKKEQTTATTINDRDVPQIHNIELKEVAEDHDSHTGLTRQHVVEGT